MKQHKNEKELLGYTKIYGIELMNIFCTKLKLNTKKKERYSEWLIKSKAAVGLLVAWDVHLFDDETMCLLDAQGWDGFEY